MIASVSEAGGGEITLVSHFTQSSVQTQTSDTIAVLSQRLESDGSVEVGSGL